MFINVTPYVVRVGKKSFGVSIGYMLREYFSKYIYVIIACCLTWYACKSIHCTTILNFIIECIGTLIIAILLFVLFYYKSHNLQRIFKLIKK